ncbi:MAG: carbohydrate binding domain-containing protein, partial [Salinivirgaceae bacterium]|nr:carbohydrate binding domain-containing protein [Salinivirgaceae bacterium]
MTRILSLLLCLLAFMPVASAQTLVVPPSPGSLTGVDHLTQSGDYTVEVKKSGDANYTTCFVYRTDNYASNMWGGEHRPQTAASFTNISFSGTSVDVRIITTSFAATSVTIRPLNYNIVPTRTGNVITFTLTTPQKISVEINNRLNPLFIFADAPDVPNTGATYYYGPGVHKIGIRKVVNSNQSVYIAGGAVVQGTFRIPSGSTNVEVRGRGIITNGNLPTLEQHTFNNDSLMKYATFTPADKFSGAPFYSQFSVNHLSFEGIIIANSAGWNFAFSDMTHQNHHNTWRNIKQVIWTGCTDGIWFDGDYNTVDDCFIFNNDDVLTTHASNNCTLTNITMWAGHQGGHLFAHYSWGSSNNISFENINMIGCDAAVELIGVDRAASSAQTIQNITFKNVRIEEHPYVSTYLTNKFIGFKSTGNITIKNWFFENITLDYKNPDEGDLNGNATGPVDGITFKNLKMGGNFITSLAQGNMSANSYASNITFSLTPEMNVKQGSTSIADNTGSYNFGSVANGSTLTKTFTIENIGAATLNLTGTPRVTVTGTGFSRIVDAATTVSAGGTTTFQIRFAPTSAGTFNGTISITNNDADENPYNFAISGTGTVISVPTNNLITNPTFDVNTTGWAVALSGGAAATIASVTQSGYSGKACKSTITNAGTSIWNVQMRQNIPLVNGKTYSISFKTSAASSRTIGLLFMKGISPYTTNYLNSNISITTNPTTYGPFTYQCNVTDNNNFFAFLLGGSTSSVYIDDVEVSEVSDNIVENPTFDTNTDNWSIAVSSGAAASISSVTQTGYSGKACKSIITNAGTSIWNVQMRQNIPLVNGKTYSISFKACAASARTIGLLFMKGISPFTTNYLNRNISITTTPTVYGPFTYQCNVTDNNNFFAFLLGGSTSSVYIDDVSIIESTTKSAIIASPVTEISGEALSSKV